ncbi:MAG: hypothetical protein JSS98_18335 [Bacteroidetes bacterium]|nr:hypothetical protein [Bacteroidota bacterium]
MNEVLTKFYKDFYEPAIPDKTPLDNQELFNLYKRPKKDKSFESPKTNRASIKPNSVYQADVLFLPEDPTTKDKYVLVVIDISARGLTDAYPFKILNAQSVLEGFKTIFARGILPAPKYSITLDKGAEFNNQTIKKYFNDKGIFISYTQTGRSRQLSFVEQRNKVIARALFMRMTSQELLTDEASLHWTQELPKLIQAINEHALKAKAVKFSDIPNINKNTILLSIGTRVRLQLDKPREVYQNQKLSGKFRATDTRWTPDIYVVCDIILDGGQPPLYRVEDMDGKIMKPAYTYNQLQVVNSTEQAPPPAVIRGEPTQYIVKDIVGKKITKGKVFYKVRWKGYKEEDDTWEPSSELTKIPKVNKLIQKYNQSH